MLRLVAGRDSGGREGVSLSGSSTVLSRFDVTSVTVMTGSLGNNQDEGGKNDDIRCKYEQSWMPDVPQQAPSASDPTKYNGHEPGCNYHDRDRRNVDTEKVDIGKSHAGAPASK
jgi:hypothetical protein